MKSSTMRLMIATAALAVAAGSASAQTYKAEIPVSFHAGDKLLAPGSYQIHLASGTGRDIVYLRNLDTSTATMLLPGVKSDAPKVWLEDGSPRLAFDCLGDMCSLSRMWNGRDTFAYNFLTSKPKPADVAAWRTTVVTLTMIKAH